MRIVDERKPTTTEFKDINVSQVFYVEYEEEYGDNPYMRIFEIKDMDDDYYNAVNLQDGRLVYLNDNEPIILCSATLKIY